MDFQILRQFPSPDCESSWRQYLTRLEMQAHYDSPEFFSEPLWEGRNPFAVLAMDGKRVCGVVTGLQPEKHVMCGVGARPQISADPSANIPETLTALVNGLLEVSNSADLVSVYTWRSLELPVFASRGFHITDLPGSLMLDLTLGSEELFKQFTKDRRRNIRYAEKNGVEVTEVTTEQEMAEAYAVYSHWRERRGKSAQGRTLSFDLYRRTVSMKGNRLFLIARVDGKVIATNIFRFFPGGLFESSANTSPEEFIHLKPNDLLQWRGIEWACRNGLRRHSLGGCHEFLLRFGGTVVPTQHYRLDRTFLRRKDLQDAVEGIGKDLVRKMPPIVEKSLRKLTGKEKISRN